MGNTTFCIFDRYAAVWCACRKLTGCAVDNMRGRCWNSLPEQMTAQLQDTSWGFAVRALLGAVAWQAIGVVLGRLRVSSPC